MSDRFFLNFVFRHRLMSFFHWEPKICKPCNLLDMQSCTQLLIISNRRRIQSTCSAVTPTADEIVCEICFDEFEKQHIICTPCSHLFCKDCYAAYIKVKILSHGKLLTRRFLQRNVWYSILLFLKF